VDKELAELRGVLIKSTRRLLAIVMEYEVAAKNATGAEIEYRACQTYATMTEDAARAEMIAGIPGKNEAERSAFLRDRMNGHPLVAASRIKVEKAQEDRDEAASALRIADVKQKAARAEVAALTAIVAGV
jgi:hypothetical protein